MRAYKHTHIYISLSKSLYVFKFVHLILFFFLDTISLARAEEDYNAPDCRFINIKKGQLIYVYSKLVKEKDSGEFWAGSVYGEQYEDHMGTVGYFPSSLVSEQHVYQEASKTVPTTDIDFFCE
ncbi:otoraplin [Egretta garzetta]|uniref:otoraplin n=1 Tax=Egretta garzetta TaxID=188379 RepID=UPI00163BA3B4|nr:otoraplin [Egretta garzetta]